ncbi:MAG: PRC-barrel domain-containing protein [Verrucomicrobia bacterium]|nr:PRC-barrel domain-containing protein [Verrucomicrobiota bacterium]
MKTKSRKLAPWMAALLCLALGQAAKAGDDQDTPKAAVAPETKTEAKVNEGTPTKVNKASSIIGMDVRNQNDEHLGHIKDLVINWKTEQVSYAVISTGAKVLLDIHEKLLAVPLSALTASEDQKHLILNADKAKVAAATGFDANDWPSVNNPSWGAEPVWQKDASKPAVPDKPADPDASAKPDTKPNQDPEAKPDMEHDSKPDKDPEASSETDSEPDDDMNPD